MSPFSLVLLTSLLARPGIPTRADSGLTILKVESGHFTVRKEDDEPGLATSAADGQKEKSQSEKQVSNSILEGGADHAEHIVKSSIEEDSQNRSSATGNVCCWKWDPATGKHAKTAMGQTHNDLHLCDLVLMDGCTWYADDDPLLAVAHAKRAPEVAALELRVPAEHKRAVEEMAIKNFTRDLADANAKKELAVAGAVAEARRVQQEATDKAESQRQAELSKAHERKQRAFNAANASYQNAEREINERAAAKQVLSHEGKMLQTLQAAHNKYACCRYQLTSMIVPIGFDLRQCKNIVRHPGMFSKCHYFQQCQECEVPLCGEMQACPPDI